MMKWSCCRLMRCIRIALKASRQVMRLRGWYFWQRHASGPPFLAQDFGMNWKIVGRAPSKTKQKVESYAHRHLDLRRRNLYHLLNCKEALLTRFIRFKCYLIYESSCIVKFVFMLIYFSVNTNMFILNVQTNYIKNNFY